jgi:membrane-associated phospholipid phosphatase
VTNTKTNTVTTAVNDTRTTITSPLTWAVPTVSLIGFVVVWLNGFNENFFLWLNGLGRTPFAETSWANITILGDTLVAIALLSPFVRKRPDIIWSLLIAAAFATLWVHGLKPLVEHLRPAAVLSNDVIHIIGVTLHKGSFPSGHTTTAFTLAGVICLSRTHPAVMITALVLATLAGVSRAVVGAHWPMDIFAGAFGGWLAAFIGVLLFKRLAQYKNWGDPAHNQSPSQIPGRIYFNTGLLLVALSLLFHDSGYPASQPFQIFVAIICIITITFNFWYLFKTTTTN